MSAALRPRTKVHEIEWIKIDAALTAGFEDMMAAHWEEVALDKDQVPLAPDWPRYRLFERQGILKALGMRSAAGKLVGYNVFFVQPPMHYAAQRWAVNDILYLDPAERSGTLGARMIREAEERFRPAGVGKIIYHAKLHVHSPGKEKGATVTDLLVRMGYRHDENVLTKLL